LTRPGCGVAISLAAPPHPAIAALAEILVQVAH